MPEAKSKQVEQSNSSSWKDTVTGIGGCALYVVFAFGVLVLFALFLNGIPWIAKNVYPWIASAAVIVLFAIVPISLLLSIFRKSRGIGSVGLLISSYIIGLSLWVWSLIVAYSLAGTFWMAVGLVLGGIGIVPIAFIAAFISREWLLAGQILITALIVYAIRALSMFLAERAGAASENLEELREKVAAYQEAANKEIELNRTLLLTCHQTFSEDYGSSGVLICAYADVIAKGTVENYGSRSLSELFSSTEKIRSAIIEATEIAISIEEADSTLELLKMLYSSLAKFLPESHAVLVTECNRARLSADPNHPGLRRSKEAELIEAEIEAEEDRFAKEFDQIAIDLLKNELSKIEIEKAKIEKKVVPQVKELASEGQAVVEAIEITKAYGNFLSQGVPIIADAELLPYSKEEIKRALLIYEQYLCDVANMYVASEQTEKLNEIDPLLNTIRSCSMFLNSYTDIEPEDKFDVDYFNSYDSIKDVPEEEQARCSEIMIKYMSKGMEEEMPGWTEMTDSLAEKVLKRKQ